MRILGTLVFVSLCLAVVVLGTQMPLPQVPGSLHRLLDPDPAMRTAFVGAVSEAWSTARTTFAGARWSWLLIAAAPAMVSPLMFRGERGLVFLSLCTSAATLVIVLGLASPGTPASAFGALAVVITLCGVVALARHRPALERSSAS